MIERKTLEARAADELRNDLMSGQVLCGERLTEVGLRERLGVSRGTVRSALHALESEGLVRSEAYTGWHARSFSLNDVVELATVRGALDGLAAELAATSITPNGRELLERALAAFPVDPSTDPGSQVMTDSDIGLHRTILELSGNRLLGSHYQHLSGQMQLLVASANRDGMTITEIASQHQPIVEAISGGESSRARALAEAHGRESGEALIGAITANGGDHS